MPTNTKTSADWRARATLTVAEVIELRLFPLSRNAVYDAINRGEIPSVRFGHRLAVPVVPLRRLLGEEVDRAS